jgi:hypothetical protein
MYQECHLLKVMYLQGKVHLQKEVAVCQRYSPLEAGHLQEEKAALQGRVA